MIRRTIPALLLATGLLLAACSSEQPHLVLETERFDFGEVVNGEIVAQDVTVRNDGAAPLVVEAVSTSCGCTAATLSPMTIAPGEQGVLHIEFDSGAHGPGLTGQVTRQIFIVSNDPQQPEVVVEFTANILGQ